MSEYNHLCMGCMRGKGEKSICPYCSYVEGSAPESALHLLPGTILENKYLIGKALGQGGFGITYLAWDLNLNIKLAIKEYLPQELAFRTSGQTAVSIYKRTLADYFDYGLDKFLAEARTLARFNEHPNIVSIRDFFKANGTAYLVMSFVEGITLKSYLESKNKPISFKQARDIFMPVLDALKEVHTAGILHRDISPDNLLISSEGRVVLIDFGAARQAIGEKSRSMSVIMKAGYSPEEQYRSKGEQGPWTDIYAVAATFYRAITGLMPPESLDRLNEDNLVFSEQVKEEIGDTLEQVLLKALAVKAKDRYQEIQEFQEALFEFKSDQDKEVVSKEMADPVQVAPEELEEKKEAAVEAEKTSGNEVKAAADDKVKDHLFRKIFADKKRTRIVSIAVGVSLLIIIGLIGGYFYLPISAIYLGKSSLHLEVGGDEVFLPVTVEPTFAGSRNLIWSSSDEQVAKVCGEGFVEPVGEGETIITVRSERDAQTATCKVTVEVPTISWEGGTYTGALKNNKPHGQGIWEHPDGKSYEGEWKEGEPHGHGTEISADRDMYVGEFIEGMYHGQGIKTFADGDKYEGEWKDSMFHGQGTFTGADGYKYEGEWKEGLEHGQGIAKFENGDKYEGEWKEGLAYGQGIVNFADGDKYEGEFQYDSFHGQGTFTGTDGYKYEGEWKEGQPHGHGTEIFANGDKYVGQFEDGYVHGRGTYTWANGHRYSGHYYKGLRHGYGVYSWPDGTKYAGQWRNNLEHGQGTYTWSDGATWEGEWKEGEPHGVGKLTDTDGSVRNIRLN